MTVPGIGAVTVRSPCAGAGAMGLRVDVRRRRGETAPEVEAPRASGRGGARSGRRPESGGCSVRNAVVVSPARTTGCATSQRRNGRFVVTPSTSVSASASARRSSASLAIASVSDQLRDQRVVRRARSRRPPRPRCRPERRPSPATDRCEAVAAARCDRSAGGSCASPRHRGAPRRRDPRGLQQSVASALSLGDADLALDEVEAGDRLGHGVLDLDPAVQLEEEELVAVDDELDRSRRFGSRSPARTRPRRRGARA